MSVQTYYVDELDEQSGWDEWAPSGSDPYLENNETSFMHSTGQSQQEGDFLFPAFDLSGTILAATITLRGMAITSGGYHVYIQYACILTERC